MVVTVPIVDTFEYWLQELNCGAELGNTVDTERELEYAVSILYFRKPKNNISCGEIVLIFFQSSDNASSADFFVKN